MRHTRCFNDLSFVFFPPRTLQRTLQRNMHEGFWRIFAVSRQWGDDADVVWRCWWSGCTERGPWRQFLLKQRRKSNLPPSATRRKSYHRRTERGVAGKCFLWETESKAVRDSRLWAVSCERCEMLPVRHLVTPGSSQCTNCSNLTTAATTDAPVSSQVQNCLQKCLSKTVDKKSSRWSLWDGGQTRVRIYWPEWERSWSSWWQKQTGGVCCVVKQRSSTSSTSSSVSWWLTAQHSQVTRTARPYRTTQYCMEYVCHLSLSFNFRTFFLQKIVLDCDKSLKVSLGQTLVNLSKYQRSIRRLCILIQWMGPILADTCLL